MPKIKTHSGAKKRFKLSKNGKVLRGHANKPFAKNMGRSCLARGGRSC